MDHLLFSLVMVGVMEVSMRLTKRTYNRRHLSYGKQAQRETQERIKGLTVEGSGKVTVVPPNTTVVVTVTSVRLGAEDHRSPLEGVVLVRKWEVAEAAGVGLAASGPAVVLLVDKVRYEEHSAATGPSALWQIAGNDDVV